MRIRHRANRQTWTLERRNRPCLELHGTNRPRTSDDADATRFRAATRNHWELGLELGPQVVAIYFHRLGNLAGGAERAVCALANALCLRGFAVQIISWDQNTASSFYHLNDKVVWHRLGFESGLVDKARRMLILVRLLREQRARVLVGFVMSGDRTIYSAAMVAGVRLIVAERNAPTMYRLRYGLMKRLIAFTMMQMADRITVQFPEFIGGYPRGLRNRIVAIPNPVEEALCKAKPGQPGPDGCFTLLAVSRLDDVQKRLDCLIRAFRLVTPEYPHWRLRIIGDGPAEARLRELVLALELSDRVTIEHSTPEIFAAYSNANLFAIPSLWEGFPNALAEAMSHGVPGVGFADAAGVSNLITDGVLGWLARGLGCERSFADALRAAMQDGEERSRRGVLAAQEMAIYGPRMVFDQWAVLLSDIMPEGST